MKLTVATLLPNLKPPIRFEACDKVLDLGGHAVSMVPGSVGSGLGHGIHAKGATELDALFLRGR